MIPPVLGRGPRAGTSLVHSLELGCLDGGGWERRLWEESVGWFVCRLENWHGQMAVLDGGDSVSSCILVVFENFREIFESNP